LYIQLYTPPMRLVGIEWDDGNLKKCQKHGVPVSEIEAVLLCKRTVNLPDRKHSSLEDRFWAVGRNAQGRGVFIVFTHRHGFDGVSLRPVSARYMHAKEVRYYETEIPGF